MGKKRKTDEKRRDDDPPEFAPENEKKKTRMANYSQQATETLLNKEQEVTRELVDLQTELSHMRSSSAVSYGNNELRQMNTKRYRAEYALGEIKAEIERRARKKLGQQIPREGIQGGSTAGVAATTTTNTAHQKTREVNAACSSVLRENPGKGGGKGGGKGKGGGSIPGGGGGMLMPGGAGDLGMSMPGLPMPGGGGGVLKSPEEMQASMPSRPAPMPDPQTFLPAPPQMGVNFHGGSAMNAMAMMGAMGGMGGGAAMPSMGGMGGMGDMPSPEEMAAASMQFQRMQQAFMGGMGGGGQPGLAGGMPRPMGGMQMMGAMPQQAPSPAPVSNVPAAFARRAPQNQG